MKLLLQIFKSFLSGILNNITAFIIISIIGGFAGLVYLYDKSIVIFKTPTPLWLTCLLIVLCCLINYLLIRIYIKKTATYDSQEKLYEEYGVLWNEDFNLRCLGCKAPLKNSSQKFGADVFFCSICNHKHTLRDENGDIITKKQAVDKLKNNPFFEGKSI